MTYTVANTATTNTFDYWRSRTNEVAHAMTNFAVTVNSNAAVGNAAVTGIFFANTLVAEVLRGGNTGSSANLVINSNVTINAVFLAVGNSTVNVFSNSTNILVRTSTSNANMTANTLFLGNTTANVSLSPGGLFINGLQLVSLQSLINVQTSGTSAQEVDNLVKATYRGSDYVFTITDNSANAHQICRVLAIHNAGDGIITEYGVVFSNTNLGSFSSNANATHVRLYFTPVPANTQVKGVKTSLVI